MVNADLDTYAKADSAVNTLRRTYRQGFDVEVAAFGALERAWREAQMP
jgi:hypothetical protein